MRFWVLKMPIMPSCRHYIFLSWVGAFLDQTQTFHWDWHPGWLFMLNGLLLFPSVHLLSRTAQLYHVTVRSLKSIPSQNHGVFLRVAFRTPKLCQVYTNNIPSFPQTTTFSTVQSGFVHRLKSRHVCTYIHICIPEPIISRDHRQFQFL